MRNKLEEIGLTWLGHNKEEKVSQVVSSECLEKVRKFSFEKVFNEFPNFKKELMECVFLEKGVLRISDSKKLLKKLGWNSLINTLPNEFLRQLKIIYSTKTDNFTLQNPKEDITRYLATDKTANKFCSILIPGYEMKKGILKESVNQELEEKIEKLINGELIAIIQKGINEVVSLEIFPVMMERLKEGK